MSHIIFLNFRKWASIKCRACQSRRIPTAHSSSSLISTTKTLNMFNLSRTHIVSALTMLCLATVSSGALIKARGTVSPSLHECPKMKTNPATINQEASVNVEVCAGRIGVGCVDIPIGSDACTDLTGGFTFLNKQISNVVVPSGFVCTFFE